VLARKDVVPLWKIPAELRRIRCSVRNSGGTGTLLGFRCHFGGIFTLGGNQIFPSADSPIGRARVHRCERRGSTNSRYLACSNRRHRASEVARLIAMDGAALDVAHRGVILVASVWGKVAEAESPWTERLTGREGKKRGLKCSGDWSEGSSRAGELSRVSRNMLPRPVSRSYDLPISS
jgi:hypothetical protein